MKFFLRLIGYEPGNEPGKLRTGIRLVVAMMALMLGAIVLGSILFTLLEYVSG